MASRSKGSIVTISDSGSDSDFINNSVSEDDSYAQSKKRNLTTRPTRISESEDDSDEVGATDESHLSKVYTPKSFSSRREEDESPEIRHGFKIRKRLAIESDSESTIESDSESAIESDAESAIESDSESAKSDDDFAMSAATRMSIHGVRPVDMDSDESVLTENEDEVPLSRLTEKQNIDANVVKQEVDTNVTDLRRKSKNDGMDHSLKDLTTNIDNSLCIVDKDVSEIILSSNESDGGAVVNEDEVPLSRLTEKQNIDANVVKQEVDTDVTDLSRNSKNDRMDHSLKDLTTNRDNSLCIVDKDVSEIILSSDESDGDAVASNSRKSNSGMPTIKKYLLPESYPNARLTYVSKQVKQNEMNKLETLREDLQKLRYLIENLDVSTLPDNGTKISLRLSKLEQDVKGQAERVAKMIVEPDKPTAAIIGNDGFDEKNEGYSWEELQAAGNKVQPKMFGKQALSTHVMERTRIMDRLRDLHESLDSRPAESSHQPQPRAVTAQLMPHQTHALGWLVWRETQRPPGGILADDMGLGKTLTMISLIAHSQERQGGSIKEEDEDWSGKENSKLIPGGTLVVCPASLIGQWAGEVTNRCKKHSLSVEMHHGAHRETKPYRLARYDMVITTYNLISRDLAKKGVLMQINWARIILDEAHIVRNHKSLTAQAVFELRGRARWCLTGTPVQNKDLDVFALLKFLRCTPFDDILMWRKWIDNKSAGGQERLATVMRCLLLRRTKQQLQEKGALASLPEKKVHNIDVTLSKEEMNVYQKVLVFSKTLFAQFLHQRAEKEDDMSHGFMSSGKSSDAYDKMHKRMVQLHGTQPVKSHEILVLLLRLRQLCCHPGLISAMLDPEEDVGLECRPDPGSVDLLGELAKLSIDDDDDVGDGGGDKKNKPVEGAEDGTSVNDALRSVLSLSNPVFDLKRTSAKMNAAIECLSTILREHADEKAVVVSQWTSVLAIVEQHLKKKGVSCTSLTGKVPVNARSEIVTRFNDAKNKTRIFLLSLCAGGVGLNLVGGNHLLLLDLHWNPQLEAQAQDRIYRVGQTRTVHIYKFMCLETVEQSIRKLQERKLEIAESVLTGAKHTKSSKLSIEDLKVLFNMA